MNVRPGDLEIKVLVSGTKKGLASNLLRHLIIARYDPPGTPLRSATIYENYDADENPVTKHSAICMCVPNACRLLNT